MHINRMKKFLVAGALLAIIVAVGCETSGQTGALAGGGIGALAGQAIGGNTSATLIGAAVGTGVGYLIGNEKDKEEARRMSAATESQQYAHTEVSPLGGTRWTVISLNPSGVTEPFTSKSVEFRPYGRVVTTTTNPDGSITVEDERYRVVGNTLIVNRPGYILNIRYRIDGDDMTMDAENFSAVLRRVRS